MDNRSISHVLRRNQNVKKTKKFDAQKILRPKKFFLFISAKIGAILGGVFGALAALILIVLVAFFLRQRRKNGGYGGSNLIGGNKGGT